MATESPLHGMRIIECSALGPAQITTPLVDLGADVIKVEPPAGDYIRQMTWPIVEGVSLMHLHLNRGKRSLVLDLRTPEGVAIMKELVQTADAVVEAMRPGSLARRGVGFDDLRGSRHLAERCEDRRKSVADSIQEQEAIADRCIGTCGIRIIAKPPGIGNHRIRPVAGQRRNSRRPARITRAWSANIDGRFRNRVFLAQLPAQISFRQDQDRSIFYFRHVGP